MAILLSEEETWDKPLTFMVHSSMYLILPIKQNQINLQKRSDMKKIIFFSAIILVAMATIIIACNKDVEGRTDEILALKPANIDLNAGAWKPVLLTGPTEFAVAAPDATTTPDYIAQVNETLAFDGRDQLKAHYLAKSGFKLSLLRLKAYQQVKAYAETMAGGAGAAGGVPGRDGGTFGACLSVLSGAHI